MPDCYYCIVSAAEIIAELPKLTQQDRAAISQRLRELEDEDSLQFLHESAEQNFREMDSMEAGNARRKAG
jgi:hypothetical protein